MKSLRIKLNLLLLSCVTLILVSFGIWEVSKARHTLGEQLQNQGAAINKRLQIGLPSLLWDYDNAAIQQVLSAEMDNPVVSAIVVTNVDGDQAAGISRDDSGALTDYHQAPENSALSLDQQLEHNLDGEQYKVGSVALHLTGKLLQQAIEEKTNAVIIQIITLNILLLFIIDLLLARVITNPLNQMVSLTEKAISGNAVTDDANDKKRQKLNKRKDEIGALVKSLNIFVSLFQENKKISDEASRVGSALNNAASSIMLLDVQGHVIYINKAFNQLIDEKQADFKADIATFSLESFIGSDFTQDFKHQFSLEASQTDTGNKTQFTLGSSTFSVVTAKVVNDEGEHLGTVLEWADLTTEILLAQEAQQRQEEDRRIAAENQRIKQALDNVSASVMVADSEHNIIYMNDSVITTLSTAEQDIQKDRPSFKVDNLLGNSIDPFYDNPGQQKEIWERLTALHKSTVVVGGRTMDLAINPVNDDEGERLGTVVEWTDRTLEVAIEEEVDLIVEAAARGDLSKRIDLTGKEGFFEKLSTGLNSLLGSVSSFVADVGIVFSAMADGDLTKPVQNSYDGDFERIKQDANNSLTKLSEVVAQIRDSATVVHTAAHEIAQGNIDLSQRTEKQASSLEETASSMQEITATVKQSAHNSEEANVRSIDARDTAQNGGEVVQQAVVAMGEILNSSNKINDIIGVIDEIAFQTNLLALNAAVEAARAGEQGRGFAVVAGEVRTLSQRSAAAAKEIKDLIRDSVNKVETGSSLVNESGNTLTSIVQAVEKVTQMISEVNTAAVEQTSGIDQVNQAITQMDEITQQNAALVEEATAASEAMSEQAGDMNRLISFFTVHGGKAPSFSQSSAASQASHQASRPSTPTTPDDNWEEF